MKNKNSRSLALYHLSVAKKYIDKAWSDLKANEEAEDNTIDYAVTKDIRSAEFALYQSIGEFSESWSALDLANESLI